jgi:hypothetical protein
LPQVAYLPTRPVSVSKTFPCCLLCVGGSLTVHTGYCELQVLVAKRVDAVEGDSHDYYGGEDCRGKHDDH